MQCTVRTRTEHSKWSPVVTISVTWQMGWDHQCVYKLVKTAAKEGWNIVSTDGAVIYMVHETAKRLLLSGMSKAAGGYFVVLSFPISTQRPSLIWNTTMSKSCTMPVSIMCIQCTTSKCTNCTWFETAQVLTLKQLCCLKLKLILTKHKCTHTLSHQETYTSINLRHFSALCSFPNH